MCAAIQVGKPIQFQLAQCEFAAIILLLLGPENCSVACLQSAICQCCFRNDRYFRVCEVEVTLVRS